ncbi:MAG: long-chain-fatty-acid--CoA ligase [bacterium]
MDLGAKIRENAQAFPGKAAVVFQDKVTTYHELNERAARCANALVSLGLGRKDRVAVLLRNRPAFLEVLYGLVKAGMTLVPVNWRLASEEMRYIIDNSESSAMVVSRDFLDKFRAIRNDLTRIPAGRTVCLDERAPAGMHAYEDLLAGASAAEPGMRNDPKDPFFIGYTSGTTGLPKGAVNPHGDWDLKSAGLSAIFRVKETDVQLLAMPLFHANALSSSTIGHYAGQTVVLMERFEPEEALRLIDRHKVTFSSMVPTMFNRIRNLPAEVFRKYDVSSLTCLVQSSAPIPFATKRWIIASFPNVGLHEFYGGTEVGVATYLPPEEQLSKPGSVGKALPAVEIKLVDEGGREVPEGETGQIVMRPMAGVPIRMATEYYKDAEGSRRSFRDGWFYTGDLAYRDREGYYYLVDRKFDMIISGGENIYPAEIEAVLHKHPGVLEAAVFGVPDEDWGESVKAMVVRKSGEMLTADEITRYCREHLAGYKVPRSVHFMEELPKTETGKVLKKVLKAPYWKGRGV